MAVNNLIALKGPKDISDGLRKLDKLKEKDAPNFRLAHGLEPKISQKQRETIYANRLLLLLHANKMDQVCLYPAFSLELIGSYLSAILWMYKSLNEILVSGNRKFLVAAY